MLADEVTRYYNLELAICLRFVEKNKNIGEEFVGLLPPEQITGVCITETVMSHLKKLGLELNNIHGQGYDGVFNLSSINNVGVQGIIKKESPLIVYVQYSGCCLNLAIAHSCSLTNLRNIINKIKATCFFSFKPTKILTIASLLENSCLQGQKQKALIDLCQNVERKEILLMKMSM